MRGDYGAALAFLAQKVNGTGEKAEERPARSFESFFEREWAQYVRDNWKHSTQTTQGSFVRRHILPHFGSMQLALVRPTHIVEFHSAMEANGLGRKTRRNLHAVLSKMFSYAHDLELIPSNPVKRGIAPKVENIEKPALGEEQLYALLDAVPVRNKAFYATLAFTGIRTGEALGLKWEDIDFADSILHVRRAIYRGRVTTPKTSGSIRPRPMVPELRQALLNHKAMAVYTQPNSYIFSSSSGRPMNSDMLRRTLQDALRKLGIVFDQDRADGLHLLRHTSGSLVYRRTANVKVTQAWLGHSSSRVTLDTYTHLMNDEQKHAADAAFSPAWPGHRNLCTKPSRLCTKLCTAAFPKGGKDGTKMLCCLELQRGRLAQLVRAPALQAGGRRFESCTAHHKFNNLTA